MGFNPCSAGSPSPAAGISSKRPVSTGFNPCSAGSPSPASPRISHRPPPPRVSILVLLDHPLLHDPRTPECWSECVVSILVLLDHPLRQILKLKQRGPDWQFQSLFCWITLSGPLRQGGRSSALDWFQSLFCWITLSGVFRMSQTPASSASFNPCSAGSPSPARRRRRPRRRHSRVSILVLLDHPLRH